MELRSNQAARAGIAPERLELLGRLCQRMVDQGVAAGLVAIVARRGTVVFERAFGRLDPAREGLPQTDALFPWGSATSLFTVSAAMVLVDDGLLGLNRPVSSYIPEFRGEGKQHILVHHLLAHSSGIRDEDVDSRALMGRVMGSPSQDSPASRAGDDPAPQHPDIRAYLELTYDKPLLRRPGTEMSQGHHTMELVGEIIRRVSGRTLPEFARERIFEPLGMKDTCFTLVDADRSRVIKRPATDANPILDIFDANEVPWACISAYTSPRDMLILGQTFLNGGWFGDVRVLSRAAVSEMTKDQVPGLSAQYRDEIFPDASWGLGWNIHGMKRALGDGSLQSPQAYYQGNSGGPLVWVDPTYEIVGVYFSSSLRRIEDEWPGDLFMNAVTASCED
jgi:CubicO group peptidase (beta-lactamase class C family)